MFNPAHAIGLFSTFNSDAVDDVTEAVETSVFGIVPSISYRRRF